MGHQNTEMDIESLQKSDRRRGRCLDVFLVVSIIFLFVTVSAVTTIGLMFMMELQSKYPTSLPSVEIKSSKLTDPSSPVYKMQNFAYLEATSSDLKNRTMPLKPVLYGEGDSVGSNFDFDDDQYSLKLKQAGTYFMYIDLKLTCTYRCRAGLLRVQLENKLTCEVELPAATSTPVSRKCWTVSWLQVEKPLLAQMTVTKAEEQNWTLELNSSGVGVFLVD